MTVQPKVTDLQTKTTWRPHAVLRLLSLVPIFGMVALAVWIITVAIQDGGWTTDVFGDEWPGWALLAVPLLLGPAFLVWRFNLSPFIEEHDDGVYIRNPFRRILIPWRDIQDCEPGYWGLTIQRRSSKPVIAVAVQKWNISFWLNRHTKADQVCERFKRLSDIARPPE